MRPNREPPAHYLETFLDTSFSHLALRPSGGYGQFSNTGVIVFSPCLLVSITKVFCLRTGGGEGQWAPHPHPQDGVQHSSMSSCSEL